MKADFKVEDPDTIQLTLTVTMSLGDWKRIKSDLSSNYPSWDFGGKIGSMIHQATQNYRPEESENGEG